MQRSTQQLRADAETIWKAGLEAVDSRRLIRENLSIDGSTLVIGDHPLDLEGVRRIVVVGGGKAGAGMAAGLEEVIGPARSAQFGITGWLNVPDDCVRSLQRITLHGARPPGVNEPTPAGVVGTRKMLEMVAAADPRDLCICLLSGGGSALMPAPPAGVLLEDKLSITQHLSAAGANITQLNTVRKQLSQIKGGRLAAACRANRMFTLVISDVIGDPLEVIASGPTVPDPTSPQDALDVLAEFQVDAELAPTAFQYLRSTAGDTARAATPSCQVEHLIIGNNATAVDAAGVQAEQLGYSHAMTAARTLEGTAESVGEHLARMALRMRSTAGPDCLITGGEPVVELCPRDQRGVGGRNQQLVLAALRKLLGSQPERTAAEALHGITLLAGGTDGEDGPTDAAGAVIDESIAESAAQRGLEPTNFLSRNDAYHFFEPLGALLKTGPTHTNVCDLRVVTVSQE